MMGDASFAHAVIDHVGMGEAVDGMCAMAVGEHRWGHHEAQCRDSLPSIKVKLESPRPE